MSTGPQAIVSSRLRAAKAAALAVSLVLSALLTAVAWRRPHDHWLAWISFLPLFVAVRSLRPRPGAWSPSQGVPATKSRTLHRTHPRAPPIPVAVPSWNLVGSAHRSL